MPFGIVLDYRIADAIDNLPGLGYKTQELAFQFPGAAQRRTKFFLDAPCAVGSDEFEGPPADHLLACIAEPALERIVDIEVPAVLVDGGRHRRRLAKQPLVIVISAHPASLYEIS